MRQIGRNETREKILSFINHFYSEHDYTPTVRDILKGCGISSTAVVQHHLNILEREGRIHRDPEVFRSIRLANRPGMLTVPVLGTIAAGQPLPVPSSDTWTTPPQDSIEVPSEITGGKQVYALRVRGHSMIDALIADGDTVILEPGDAAHNGDMVAVWLKDERSVTLKRIYASRNQIVLKPENAAMEPIIQRPENVQVQGKVIGVIRKIT